MIERVGDPTNLPYEMVITHLLEAHNISLSSYPHVTITKSYNSRVVARMGYVAMKDTWINKQEGEAMNAPTDSKTKALVSPPSVCYPDLMEKLKSNNDKLAIIKDLLVSLQTITEDIYGVSKETGSNASKIRVQILRIAESTVKACKEVHDRIDRISLTVNASFDRFKKAIFNTLTYFLCR